MSQNHELGRNKNLYNPESTGAFRSSQSGTRKSDELLSVRDESAKDILKEIGLISRKDYEYYKQRQSD
jgi:hypothetical protein